MASTEESGGSGGDDHGGSTASQTGATSLGVQTPMQNPSTEPPSTGENTEAITTGNNGGENPGTELVNNREETDQLAPNPSELASEVVQPEVIGGVLTVESGGEVVTLVAEGVVGGNGGAVQEAETQEVQLAPKPDQLALMVEETEAGENLTVECGGKMTASGAENLAGGDNGATQEAEGKDDQLAPNPDWLALMAEGTGAALISGVDDDVTADDVAEEVVIPGDLEEGTTTAGGSKDGDDVNIDVPRTDRGDGGGSEVPVDMLIEEPAEAVEERLVIRRRATGKEHIGDSEQSDPGERVPDPGTVAFTPRVGSSAERPIYYEDFAEFVGEEQLARLSQTNIGLVAQVLEMRRQEVESRAHREEEARATMMQEAALRRQVRAASERVTS